jgi:integrase
MLTKAADWELIPLATLLKARKVKMLPERNKRLRFLSVEEKDKLLASCGERVRPVALIALNAGMRLGEILALPWSLVDLLHGLIHIPDSKNNEPRHLPINDELRACLKKLPRSGPFVFGFLDGTQRRSCRTAFDNALEAAKIKDFHFHDLRHTFASHLVMAGVDLVTVKELLGHKSISTTMRYSHLAPSHLTKAVENIYKNNVEIALQREKNQLYGNIVQLEVTDK